MKATKPTVLCVDDEQNVVESLQLNLRRHFQVRTALSGAAGLETLRSEPDIAVVISDMRMPEMDGASFLAEVKNVAPTAVRMLLTGYSDIEAAMRAVNEGQIFRFLTKPCAPDHLLATLTAGVEQHRLITAERVLLQKTLLGSVKAMVEILALSNPMALGRAMRIRDTVLALATELRLEQSWRVEFAALLSQLGSVSLPDETVRKLYDGDAIDESERAKLIDNMDTTNRILSNIPRLEPVTELLHALKAHTAQQDAQSGSVDPATGVLLTAIDVDTLEAQGFDAAETLRALGKKPDVYGAQTLEALRRVKAAPGELQTTTTTLDELVDGMVLCEDLETANGVVILPRGFSINRSSREHIRNFAAELGNVSIKVRAPNAASSAGELAAVGVRG
jgi:response regulator RpfG family c-di-GMP phosphodiesterase